jgi:hypothetical protein
MTHDFLYSLQGVLYATYCLAMIISRLAFAFYHAIQSLFAKCNMRLHRGTGWLHQNLVHRTVRRGRHGVPKESMACEMVGARYGRGGVIRAGDDSKEKQNRRGDA